MSVKQQFQFRLRALLLIAAVSALLLGMGRNAIVGRLELEPEETFTIRKPRLFVFHCSSSKEAASFKKCFDKQDFIDRAVKHARNNSPQSADALQRMSLSLHAYGPIVWFKFDFARWGRSRLDVTTLSLVHDLSDPIASERNNACLEAVVAIATDYRWQALSTVE